MINFNEPPVIGTELDYIKEAINNKKICGDGSFTKKCNDWFEEKLNVPKHLLTTSCTHALEMSAILANISNEDEIIAPSYTFVSTINAFVLRGAKVKFVDIRPDTMNIDENLIEQAITSRTKAIVVVHYAGIGCEMDTIMAIAKKYHLVVIEDAAQGMMSTYNNKPLGTIGHFGTYSYHETKNYSCGEGGSLIINDKKFIDRAEIIREKGTDRTKFLRGQLDKYSWVDIGSSYLPSELNAAYLFAQLEVAEKINNKRLSLWNHYNERFYTSEVQEFIDLPFIPDNCQHNAHMYYIKVKDIDIRSKLIDYLKKNDIYSVFHYIPLHSAKAGLKYGEFIGNDNYTTKESERLLRLPMFFNLKNEQVEYITEKICNFFVRG